MIRKEINLFWMKNPKPGNMGDILPPFIFEKLGFKPKYVSENTENKLLSIGSIISRVNEGDTVWGSGIIHRKNKIELDANYLAVRGPLTGEQVGCQTYGDPALLCPLFWKFENESTIKKIGIVPHYVDYELVDGEKINILNANPINVIKNIIKYESIVSSSLHGIIIAHAYGIPAAWIKLSNNLTGDNSKFEDYALSVDIELRPYDKIEDVKFVLPDSKKIEKIQQDLLNKVNEI